MELKYHQKTFDLLQISPSLCEKSVEQIYDFEIQYKVNVPPSLREWYSIENHMAILQHLIDRTLNHNLINLTNSFTFGQMLDWLPTDLKYIYILEENQCCFHMAVELTGSDNPPVLFRHYEPEASWELHAESFSDWLLAITWDSINYDNFAQFDDEIEFETFLEESSEFGPTTYYANMWLYASKFMRGFYNGKRQTFII